MSTRTNRFAQGQASGRRCSSRTRGVSFRSNSPGCSTCRSTATVRHREIYSRANVRNGAHRRNTPALRTFGREPEGQQRRVRIVETEAHPRAGAPGGSIGSAARTPACPSRRRESRSEGLNSGFLKADRVAVDSRSPAELARVHRRAEAQEELMHNRQIRLPHARRVPLPHREVGLRTVRFKSGHPLRP